MNLALKYAKRDIEKKNLKKDRRPRMSRCCTDRREIVAHSGATVINTDITRFADACLRQKDRWSWGDEVFRGPGKISRKDALVFEELCIIIRLAGRDVPLR